MKTLLSAVLMIAVSAWGQSKPATSKAGAYPCPSGYHVEKVLHWDPPFGDVNSCKQDKPKPHKPKPSGEGDYVGDPGRLCDPKHPGSGEGCIISKPDKAAVPVEPECWKDKSCKLTITGPSISMVSTDGSRVALLSDSEYSHLEQLRASVVEEEKRLAEKYGARPEVGCKPVKDHWGSWCIDVESRPADHYGYKGQFLLIDKGGK